MKLGSEVQSVSGEIHQLISRGQQLLAVINGRLVPLVGGGGGVETPDDKVRSALPCADGIILACQGNTLRVNGQKTYQPMGVSSELFWNTWDVRSLLRFSPNGFCNARQPMILAAGVRRASNEHTTILARYVQSDRSWSQLGSRIPQFKVRAVVAYQFNSEANSGKTVPILFGHGGALYLPSPNSDFQFLANARPRDFRDAVVMQVNGADVLYGVGQSGFNRYDDEMNTWVCESEEPFSTCLLEHEDRSDIPVVLAAGRDRLVSDDGYNCTEMLSWGRKLIPTSLVVHQGELYMAYQIKGEPGVSKLSIIEGYFE